MWTGCFECQATIEGDDADTIADRLVAHGLISHNWPYPEEAIRNYARNYAGATQRLSDRTDRLDRIGPVEVHPVTEERIDD